MNPNIATAKRLKQLRESRGWSQDEFSKRFSDFTSRVAPMATMTISAWETARKMPSASTIIDLATFYAVSTDYVYGLTDTIDEKYTGTKSISNRNHDIQIAFHELEKFDKQPIYVVFNNMKYRDSWGICDYVNKKIVFTDFKMVLTNQCTYYYTIPTEQITILNKANHLLQLKDVMKKERVYVESLAPDPYIQGRLNGWYKHSVDKTFLINEKGQTLSYEGLGVTYNIIEVKN